jgi:hypothetical protein
MSQAQGGPRHRSEGSLTTVNIKPSVSTLFRCTSAKKMAIWRRSRLLWQSSPGVPSGVMVCQRILARTGRRAVGAHALAILPPLAILPCLYHATSGCAPKSVGTRKPPSYLARRLDTAGLQLAAAIITRIRIIQRCTRGRFAPTPALWVASYAYLPVRAIVARACLKYFLLFRLVVGVRSSCGGWCIQIYQ